MIEPSLLNLSVRTEPNQNKTLLRLCGERRRNLKIEKPLELNDWLATNLIVEIDSFLVFNILDYQQIEEVEQI